MTTINTNIHSKSDSKANTNEKPRQRLHDIDSAKGIAIILVVFGHIVMRDQPAHNEWYGYLRDSIYTFHMPFFMYLTGLVMFFTGAAATTTQAFKNFIKKRAIRFLLPFMLMGILIYFGKAAARIFIHVDNAGMGVFDGLSALLWDTHASPAMSLWYIFVVFQYCLILPPLLWLTKGNVVPIFIASIIIYFSPLPEYVYLDKAGHNFVFFIIGGLVALNLTRYQNIIDRYRMHIGIAFLLSLPLIFIDMNWVVRMAIIGTLSLPAIHSLARIKNIMHSKILLFFGTYTFVIYLFNTIMIGVTKGVMFKVIHWDGLNFLLFVPILFAAGLIGPILLKFIILRRIPFLDKITN